MLLFRRAQEKPYSWKAYCEPRPREEEPHTMREAAWAIAGGRAIREEIGESEVFLFQVLLANFPFRFTRSH